LNTLDEIRILISYRIINGRVTIIWLIQSGEGVITAATTKNNDDGVFAISGAGRKA
jgi:hypothetical protein